jgi:hypothetical protein
VSPGARPAVVSALLGLALLNALAQVAVGSEEATDPHHLVRRLMAESRSVRREAAAEARERRDPSLLPAMVDALFFTPRAHRGELFEVLEELAAARPGRRYLDWVEHLTAHPELRPAAGYAEWKAELLARIDPRYRHVFYPGAPAHIRLEEVVPGGVPLGGIPALVNPPHQPAREARYLSDRERVFGVALDGEARAYPLRILSWHELANDVVGGEPVALSYCTLCGSGILYSSRTPAGGAYLFGTSGLLYRSNKLMFDEQTLSLWSNLTGEAVVGRSAAARARLEMLPMTLTTWGEWRRQNPHTTVLALETGHRGFDYRPGAADRARRGVEFPLGPRDPRLEPREEVFALRLAGEARAYPVAAVAQAGVVEDELGGIALVLLTDGGGGVRAYRRGERRFGPGGTWQQLVDERGRAWRVEEDGLRAIEDGESLARVPGHVAFWMGWFAFYPDTGVWQTP